MYEFESHCPHFGDITQLVECMLCKHKATGSSPVISIDGIIQLVECWNHTPNVIGSIPIIISTECSAVGSVFVLGTKGHAFESHHSDLNFKYEVFTFNFMYFNVFI